MAAWNTQLPPACLCGNYYDLKNKNVNMFPYNTDIHIYTGCPRGNVPDFGRVFLMLNYTDVTQNTYI